MMTMQEYLLKAIQDDARRAGQQERLLREARRARKAGRRRLVPLPERGGPPPFRLWAKLTVQN
jgi:hypothetical protein